MTNSNQLRAGRCEQALAAYSDADHFTNLVDFLADAMHWCDFTGQDFHYALCVAGKHFIAELNDSQTEERRLP
ncbi:MAG: hypothetical protein NTW75_00350 [Planctomycetales bacterium]|nr:hypothetical protein [Planctomycetales bacterium]